MLTKWCLQRDLVAVFGTTFLVLGIALLWYWMCLRRAKLFDRIEKLREEHSVKPTTATTPRQPTDSTIRHIVSPYLAQPIPIKLEHAD